MIQPGLPPTIPPPTAKPAQTPPAPQQSTNVKDTIESILVAFILAFIFRAFVVEAFVIPTGSMAPTLLGAHMRFFCPDCGYRFTTNYSSQRSQDDDVYVPNQAEPVEVRKDVYETRVFPIHCPNCGFKFPKETSKGDDNDATSPPVHHGDRILVMKYLYLFQDPNRWDVVVFKSPEAPAKYDYTQNYIKRLVGKPNEIIMILDGNIYVAPNTGQAPAPADFRVQTKPPEAQDALWRIVYDNDFHPRGQFRAREWKQPWTPSDASSWDQSANGGRTFRFTNANGAATLRFDPNATPDVFPLSDFVGYDQTHFGYPPDYAPIRRLQGDIYDAELFPPKNNVSEVKLALNYRRTSGDGSLRLRLSKLDQTFIAEITPDKVRLLRVEGPGTDAKLVSETEFDGRSDRARRIDFQNVDYRVSLSIDGKELLATDATYAPDVDMLLNAFNRRQRLPKPTIEITAEKQTCELSHVGLWRDVYYTNLSSESRDGVADVPMVWANPVRFPNHLMVLGPDEYFVCGDNSLISGDARIWKSPINLPYEELDVQAGRVPGRFMLGKAFFVYWPAGYRPLPNLPGLAPNFGQMRFIH